MLANTQTKTSVALLSDWLANQITFASFAWLEEQKAEIIRDAAERKLFTAFSAVSRYVEKII